jgi:2-methylisocitrate lyase-like PEP mutase family enzyme
VTTTLAEKAERLLALHHTGRTLVLPNVWDPGGARMLEALGYPAVATASASVAFSLGYDDGEQITLEAMLDVVRRIAAAVQVPVSADMERGWAESPDAVAAHMRDVLRAGAVGVNLEDSVHEGQVMYDVALAAARIRAVREMARHEGVPLVINARTDVYLRRTTATDAEKFDEAVARARAYLAAGADCFYPITLGDLPTLTRMQAAVQAPINVFAPTCRASLRELEAAGIARLSLGPGLYRAALTAMRNVAVELQQSGSFDGFTRNVITSGEIRKFLSKEPMK